MDNNYILHLINPITMHTHYYHFSFDVKDIGKNFGNYDDAKRFITCLLLHTGAKIHSDVASTYILKYENRYQDFGKYLFPYLERELDGYYHFRISLIQFYRFTIIPVIASNPNESIQDKTEEQILNYKCDDKYAVETFKNFEAFVIGMQIEERPK